MADDIPERIRYAKLPAVPRSGSADPRALSEAHTAINLHLINFYTQLQRGLEITIAMQNNERSFYRHRTRFNQLIKEGKSQSAEAAQLFYYLNRTCFNGLCRFNQSGEFNVPFGTHSSI